MRKKIQGEKKNWLQKVNSSGGAASTTISDLQHITAAVDSPNPDTWAPRPSELPGASMRSARLLNWPSARLKTRLEAKTVKQREKRIVLRCVFSLGGCSICLHHNTAQVYLCSESQVLGKISTITLKTCEVLLFREDRLLVPPKRERVAELPDTPGGETSITR